MHGYEKGSIRNDGAFFTTSYVMTLLQYYYLKIPNKLLIKRSNTCWLSALPIELYSSGLALNQLSVTLCSSPEHVRVSLQKCNVPSNFL